MYMRRDVHILLVDDDHEDIELTSRELRHAGYPVNINAKTCPVAAWEYLTQLDNVPLPDLAIFDINMPRLRGLDLLKRVKEHPHMRGMPVIMLTTSQCTTDIDIAYRNGCDMFLNKPCKRATFAKVLQHFDEFWFRFIKSNVA